MDLLIPKLDPQAFAEQVIAKVPVSLWEQITPIFIENFLRADNAPPYLGGGMLYEDIIKAHNASNPNELVTAAVPRNSAWEKESQVWLKDKVCLICGGKFRLVAHHIIPFHMDMSKEMDPNNWAPLCEGRPSCNCHLTFGHFGSWVQYNPLVLTMGKEYFNGFNKAHLNRGHLYTLP